jgi:energy-coupling factor transport system permease protein
MKISRIFIYEPKNRYMYRLNPLIKVLWMLVFSVAAFSTEVYSNIIYLFLLIVFFMISDIKIIRVASSLKAIYLFLALTLLGNIFLTPGEVLFRIFGVPGTKEGLQAGLLISLRLVNVFFASLLLSFTTSHLQLSETVEKLLSPLGKLKINVSEIAFIFSLTLRALMILLNETEELVKSFRARGIISERMGFLRRLRIAAYILIPLILITVKRSEEMGFALLVRGFNPERKRIILNRQKFGVNEILFSAIWFLAFISGVLIGK